MNILIVLGTRPEAIKLAPVIDHLKKHDKFIVSVCNTAQHKELLYPLFHIFNIQVDYDLAVMKSNQDLFDITTRTLLRLRSVLESNHPNLIIVQGDTTTAFASSLAAFYCKIPAAHVEAGLRTHNRLSPYPEEMNRSLIAQLASLHFAPTEKAKLNLLAESIPESNIFVTGNTVVDSLQQIASSLSHDAAWNELAMYNGLMADLQQNNCRLILVTSHRRENFGEPLSNICDAIKRLIELFDDVVVVYPVHPNPNVRELVYKKLTGIPRVYLINPVTYPTLVFLLKSSYIILTDSGGIQEEAPTFGVPVLVLRDTTERTEGVEAGIATLVGTNPVRIVEAAKCLLTDKDAYAKMSQAVNPYGDGHAAERIVKTLEEVLLCE